MARCVGVRGEARGLLAALTGVLAVVCLLAAPALASLPEGRVYEQVSPEFKAGYGVFLDPEYSFMALDGERVKFVSLGAFNHSGENTAVNPYVAHRTSAGWVTEGLFPHANGECLVGVEVFSADLSRFDLVGELGTGDLLECSTSATNTVWVRQPGGSLTQISPVMTTVGGLENATSVLNGSSDLSRLVVSRNDLPGLHVLPEEINDETITGDQLYEMEGLHARLVGVDGNSIQLTKYCDVRLGGSGSRFGAVSQPAASEVFFSVNVNTRTEVRGECEVASPAHPQELFLRAAGSQTLEVSKPLAEVASCGARIPCPRAEKRAPTTFQGASEDGSIVYFTMADTAGEPLVPGNSDRSNDLYVARIGCAGGMLGEVCGSAPREVVSLELASPDIVVGQAAEVQPEALAVSPDGSHAYFVAHGVLSEAANGEGETAVEGAENLYVYDRSSLPARVSFIADLCSGPEVSGSVRDVRCPASLVAGNDSRLNDSLLYEATAREAQTTGDGRFLVFGTYARLISAGPEADTDSSEDIYRYDAETGILRRVSVAEAGQDGNGNGAFDAHIAGVSFHIGLPQEQYELDDRAITEDGSRVVFTTSEPLSARDATGQQDVYVWNEGRVGMISCGCSTEADAEPVITPSGNDVMFLTTAGLVPSDTDGLTDIYDARVNGGFPAPEALSEPCVADSCYGPLSTPAPILVPGSVTQPAGQDLPTPPAAEAKTVKQTTPMKAQKRHRHRGKARRRARKSTHTRGNWRHGR